MTQIKAEELRIGNIIDKCADIQHDGTWYVKCTAEDIAKLKHSWETFTTHLYRTWGPVSITEELLLKAGFVRGGYEGITVSLGNFELHGDCIADYPGSNPDEFAQLGVRINDKIDVYIYYVHQLQNLYFALTGKELTI